VITGCTVTADLSVSGGEVAAGAIAGVNWRGTIENSRASGRVTNAGGNTTGGIAGQNCSLIKNCYADVTVTADVGQDWWSWVGTGGITGFNVGRIENSYSTGAVNGFIAGGIAGTNTHHVETGVDSSGIISNCYAAGAVTSSGTGAWYSAGGIAGIHANDPASSTISISNCVALNTSVTSSVSSSYTRRMLGRNVASGALANNWGLATGMTITAYGGAVTPSLNTTTGVDGADFTNSGQASWSAAAGTGPAFAFGTSDAAPWVWDSVNGRPKLYWE
ncbi:MAG: hypothetical protein LBT16_06775, partial [Treponema sp.]|nr:hypothetical protein [Treponema sp.]